MPHTAQNSEKERTDEKNLSGVEFQTGFLPPCRRSADFSGVQKMQIRTAGEYFVKISVRFRPDYG